VACDGHRVRTHKGIRWMRVCHGFTAVFDDPNLVSCAGLAPVLRLRLRRPGLVEAHVARWAEAMVPSVDPTKRDVTHPVQETYVTAARLGQLRTVGSPHCSRLVSIPPGHRAELLAKGIANLVAARGGTAPPRDLWDHAPSCSSCRFELASRANL
jgi:hypothetical protein